MATYLWYRSLRYSKQLKSSFCWECWAEQKLRNHFQSRRPFGRLAEGRWSSAVTVSPTLWTNQGRGSGVLLLTGGWTEVTTLKCPSLAINTQKKATVEDNLEKVWGCQQNSSHRWHLQWIQTTKRMEMGVKEISGKPWLVKTKRGSRENRELYSEVHILNRNKYCLCIKTRMGTKLSDFIKNKGKRDNLRVFLKKNYFPRWQLKANWLFMSFEL